MTQEKMMELMQNCSDENDLYTATLTNNLNKYEKQFS